MGFLDMFFAGAAGAPGEFKREHDLFDAKRAILVDVRSPQEFAGGHAKGAINIPMDQVGARLKEFGPKDQTVVVYCRSGNRSSYVATQLKNQGYQDVIDAKTQQRWDSGR